ATVFVRHRKIGRVPGNVIHISVCDHSVTVTDYCATDSHAPGPPCRSLADRNNTDDAQRERLRSRFQIPRFVTPITSAYSYSSPLECVQFGHSDISERLDAEHFPIRDRCEIDRKPSR